jgi:hypothetical protein
MLSAHVCSALCLLDSISIGISVLRYAQYQTPRPHKLKSFRTWRLKMAQGNKDSGGRQGGQAGGKQAGGREGGGKGSGGQQGGGQRSGGQKGGR